MIKLCFNQHGISVFPIIRERREGVNIKIYNMFLGYFSSTLLISQLFLILFLLPFVRSFSGCHKLKRNWTLFYNIGVLLLFKCHLDCCKYTCGFKLLFPHNKIWQLLHKTRISLFICDAFSLQLSPLGRSADLYTSWADVFSSHKKFAIFDVTLWLLPCRLHSWSNF